MKNYKLMPILVLLIFTGLTSYSQTISFKVDLNDTGYPAEGADIRIGGNANGTGWTSSKVLLTDDDNDGIWVGNYENVPVGEFLFRVFQGTGDFGTWAGSWITDVTRKGCVSSEANYSYQVASDTNVTISFVLNECYSVTQGTLSYQSLDLVDFSVYPNPADDFVKITTVSGVSSVAIYDLLGSKILETITYDENNGLNVSSLAPGVYVVVVESDGDKGLVKFVKK